MDVTLLLADSAQVADGKVYILGGGWSFISPGFASMAVAAVVEVPWDKADDRHQFVLSLLDEDGMPYPVPQADGTTTSINVNGEFAVGRPEGSVPGSSVHFPIALNFNGVPLQPDMRLVWSLGIGEHTWNRAFTVRSA